MMGTAAPTDGMSVNIETMEATATQLSTAARALSITDDVVKNLQNRIDRRGWDAVNTALNALAAARADLASSIQESTQLKRQINERIVLLQEANSAYPDDILDDPLARRSWFIRLARLDAQETTGSPDKDRIVSDLLQQISALDSTDEDYLIERNKKITKFYAQLYLQNPQLYKWAGMAALASAEVGKAMDDLRKLEVYYENQLARLLSSPLQAAAYYRAVSEAQANLENTHKLFRLLADGNLAVYKDIGWQFIAYQQGDGGTGGLDKLEAAAKVGALDPHVFQSWQKIDEGARTGDQNLVWEGNKELLIYEQTVVLQPIVYDPAPGVWQWSIQQLHAFPFSLFGKRVDSPVPAGTTYCDKRVDSPVPIPVQRGTDFEHDVPDANISDVDARMKWILDDILPEYRKLLDNRPEDVSKIMEALHNGASFDSVQQLLAEDDPTCEYDPRPIPSPNLGYTPTSNPEKPPAVIPSPSPGPNPDPRRLP